MGKPRTKKILHAILGSISAVLTLSAFYYALLVYAVRKFVLSDMSYYDGLGRKLESPPKLIRILITDGAMWPGIGASALDVLILWGALITAYLVARPLFIDR